MWKRLGARVGAMALLLGLGSGAAALGATVTGPLNAYSASLSASQHADGSPSAPAPIGLTEVLKVRPVASTYADPITSLGLTLSQVRANPAGFPVCTAASVNAIHSDADCPSGALVATANLTMGLWSAAQPGLPTQPCFARIDVWNAGADKLTAFVVFPTGYWCDDLQTGAVPAWTGTLSQTGSTLKIALPLVPGISTDTGGSGLYAAIDRLTFTVPALTRTVGRTSVGFLASTGCVAHKRPGQLTLSASNGGRTQSSSLAQQAGC